MKRCVTVNSFIIIVKAFFAQHADFTLAIDIGSEDHDTIVFTKKLTEGGRGTPSYAHIHYNPNIDEELSVANYYFKKMSEHFRLQGYHSKDGNLNAECSILSWTEVFKFMRLKFDPFEDQRIDLWQPDKKNHRLKYIYLEDLMNDNTIDID